MLFLVPRLSVILFPIDSTEAARQAAAYSTDPQWVHLLIGLRRISLGPVHPTNSWIARSTMANANTRSNPERGTRISDTSVRPSELIAISFRSEQPFRRDARVHPDLYIASRSYVSIYPPRSPARSCSGLPLSARFLCSRDRRVHAHSIKSVYMRDRFQ